MGHFPDIVTHTPVHQRFLPPSLDLLPFPLSLRALNRVVLRAPSPLGETAQIPIPSFTSPRRLTFGPLVIHFFTFPPCAGYHFRSPFLGNKSL